MGMKIFSRWVQITFWYYSLLLLSIKITSYRQYMQIFFVVWALVQILGTARPSAEFSSIPLVILQIGKNALILAWLYSQLQPVIRGLFRRFGYRLTSIFQEKTRKIKFGIFETLRGHIFNHIGGAQKRFLMYFPYYLPIRNYAWKMVQNWFFLPIFENFRKNCLFAKKGMAKSSTYLALSLRV